MKTPNISHTVTPDQPLPFNDWAAYIHHTTYETWQQKNQIHIGRNLSNAGCSGTLKTKGLSQTSTERKPKH